MKRPTPNPLRVLEVGERLSGAFACLALAASGAIVCQVRRKLDRRLDDIESAYYDRGRLVLDEDADLATLAGHADVLVTDLHPYRMRELGLPTSAAELRQWQPRLLQVAITAFGLGSPYSDYETEDITEWAAGGLAYVTRRVVADHDDVNYTPLLAPNRQPELLGGLTASVAVFGGLRQLEQVDRSVLVDVSRQEAQIGMSHSYLPTFVNNYLVPGNPDNRLSTIGMLLHPMGGDVYLRPTEAHQWHQLFDMMENPEWASDLDDGTPIYLTDAGLVNELVGAWATERTKAWLLSEGKRRRIPVAEPAELADVLAAPQLLAREFIVPLSEGNSVYLAPQLPIIEPAEWPASRSASTEEVLTRWRR